MTLIQVEDRLRNQELAKKVMSADEAAQFIKDGMTLGLSRFYSLW